MCGKALPFRSRIFLDFPRGSASPRRHSLKTISSSDGKPEAFRTSGGRAGTLATGVHNTSRTHSMRGCWRTKETSVAPSHHDLLFTNYEIPMIGFDRSAFAAIPRLCRVSQSKCESSECSTHNEGLPEHPIKNSNRTSVPLASRTNYAGES